MRTAKQRLKTQITQSVVILCTAFAVISTVFSVKIYAESQNESGITDVLTEEKASVMKYALIAASVAFGLGAIGAGFAISHVGAAAMGAVAEKPEIAMQALIFVGLAEGIVVFGFITALMILGKI